MAFFDFPSAGWPIKYKRCSLTINFVGFRSRVPYDDGLFIGGSVDCNRIAKVVKFFRFYRFFFAQCERSRLCLRVSCFAPASRGL